MSVCANFFSLGCVKVSILLMYLRAFTGNKSNQRLKYTIWVLIFLISGAHLIAFLAWTFEVLPVWCHWTYFSTDAEQAQCRHPSWVYAQVPYSVFLNVFTVVVDFIILYLPVRPVWQLQLPKRQRISILAIMFAGVMYEQVHSR